MVLTHIANCKKVLRSGIAYSHSKALLFCYCCRLLVSAHIQPFYNRNRYLLLVSWHMMTSEVNSSSVGELFWNTVTNINENIIFEYRWGILISKLDCYEVEVHFSASGIGMKHLPSTLKWRTLILNSRL